MALKETLFSRTLQESTDYIEAINVCGCNSDIAKENFIEFSALYKVIEECGLEREFERYRNEHRYIKERRE